jgi:hypothetical protein
MKHLIRYCLLLFVVGLLAASCSQKSDPGPTPAILPATGNITGTISPAGAITQVTAKDAGGLTFIATPDAKTGVFTHSTLATGQYTLSFTMATGYQPVAAKTITVTAGQTVSAGTVQATSDGSIKGGTMTWTVDGKTYSTTDLSGVADATTTKTLYVVGKSASGTQVDQIQLRLGTVFYGVDTYPLQSGYYEGRYVRTVGGVTTLDYNTANVRSTTQGSLIVTQFDAVAGTAAGTFAFTGANLSNNTTTQTTVTNGSFSIRF